MGDAAGAETRGRIFISYRRRDTGGTAGRLYDRLARRFGEEQVFIDVGSIRAGADFRKTIDGAMSSCDVLLALIGTQWVTITDEAGRRRLDHPDDLIVFEIAAAIQRDISIIPVLVDEASMPRRSELPASIVPIVGRNAVALDQRTFNPDVDQLIEDIAGIMEDNLLDSQETGQKRRSPRAGRLASANRRSHSGRPPTQTFSELFHRYPKTVSTVAVAAIVGTIISSLISSNRDTENYNTLIGRLPAEFNASCERKSTYEHDELARTDCGDNGVYSLYPSPQKAKDSIRFSTANQPRLGTCSTLPPNSTSYFEFSSLAGNASTFYCSQGFPIDSNDISFGSARDDLPITVILTIDVHQVRSPDGISFSLQDFIDLRNRTLALSERIK